MIVTRFAPSPTGDLHLGGALVALHSFWLSRVRAGRCLLRIEDLDTPRVVLGSEERILEDLAWLRLSFDRTASQSTRAEAYLGAIEKLGPSTYLCDCSRKEIVKVASAPHEGEELVYPGTCRDRDPARVMKRPPALRLRLPERTISFVDGERGPMTGALAEKGDLVLRRGDGVFAYHLAVVVDDLEGGVTDVIRGDDLLASTPRQLYLAELIGATSPPRYTHLPLVRDETGERVAKRTKGGTVRELRERGVRREAILGVLAFAFGLTDDDAPRSLEELARIPERKHAARPLVVEHALRHFTSVRGTK